MSNIAQNPPTQYDIKNAAYKVDGYYQPSPSKAGGPEPEFTRARDETIQSLLRQIECIRALTFEQFSQAKVKGFN